MKELAVTTQSAQHIRCKVLVFSDLNTLSLNIFSDAGLESFEYVAPQIKGPSYVVSLVNKGVMPLIGPPSAGSMF